MSVAPSGTGLDRRNNLNAVRLALALMVLVSHLHPILLGQPDPALRGTSLGGVALTGFFLLSGYLVSTSWNADPVVRSYLAKRAARIIPAFWVCLLVTAFAVVPLIGLVEQGDRDVSVTSVLTYPLRNVALFNGQTGVDGALTTTPLPGTLNGSLYTLLFEAGCYLVVLAAGVWGLVRSRWFWAAVVGAAWLVGLGLHLAPALNLNSGSAYSLGGACSLGLAFAVGAAWHVLPGKVTLRWPLAVVALCAYGASLLLPGVVGPLLRPAAELCLLYALLVLGTASPVLPWLHRHDLSYGTYLYAFPLTQLMAAALPDRDVLAATGATAATVVLAAGSWALVERPALRAVRGRALAPRQPTGAQRGTTSS